MPITRLKFESQLDYSDLATNALWAGWVYDNPGRDTDSDGFKGTPVRNPCVTPGPDTLFYPNGDGVPDFSGPPPPTPPTSALHRITRKSYHPLERQDLGNLD